MVNGAFSQTNEKVKDFARKIQAGDVDYRLFVLANLMHRISVGTNEGAVVNALKLLVELTLRDAPKSPNGNGRHGLGSIEDLSMDELLGLEALIDGYLTGNVQGQHEEPVHHEGLNQAEAGE